MTIPASVALGAYANAARSATGAQASGAVRSAEGHNFADVVNTVLDDMVSTSRQGEKVSMQAVAKKADVVDVVTAVAEAEVAVQTVVAVRDRVVSAYQEIIRMPV